MSWPFGLAAQAAQNGYPRAPGADSLNLGFEVASTTTPLTPAGWYTGGQGYEIRLDTVKPFAGARSLRITGPATPDPRGFGVASRSIPVPHGAGRTVHLRGYIRTEDIGQGYAGLWLRTDAAGGRMLALENMSSRGIAGTWPWTAFVISLPLDSATASVAFEVLHPGDGSAWFDSLSIDIDGRALSDAARSPSSEPQAGAAAGRLAADVHLGAVTPLPESARESWLGGRITIDVVRSAHRIKERAAALFPGRAVCELSSLSRYRAETM